MTGALIAGFRGGSRAGENTAELIEFVSQPHVCRLDVTFETARTYGVIFQDLRSKGTAIPTNDIWIAAHALDASATVVTFDRHFLNVSTLDTIHLTHDA